MQLSPVEVRVVGSLIEKELTTPQYYPLTLNALTAACNQTSNRNPVLNLDETVVRDALDTLKEKGLCRVVHSPSNRAVKFRQVVHEVYALEPPELAVLGVLMLRGPQTVGELRGRTERMVQFSSVQEVDDVVTRLEEKVVPLAIRLPRQPGQKEGRVAHLLGTVHPLEQPLTGDEGAPAGADPPHPPDRLAEVEAELGELRDEVARLRADLDTLRAELG